MYYVVLDCLHEIYIISVVIFITCCCWWWLWSQQEQQHNYLWAHTIRLQNANSCWVARRVSSDASKYEKYAENLFQLLLLSLMGVSEMHFCSGKSNGYVKTDHEESYFKTPENVSNCMLLFVTLSLHSTIIIHHRHHHHHHIVKMEHRIMIKRILVFCFLGLGRQESQYCGSISWFLVLTTHWYISDHLLC